LNPVKKTVTKNDTMKMFSIILNKNLIYHKTKRK
jgi:hypothetical protein